VHVIAHALLAVQSSANNQCCMSRSPTLPTAKTHRSRTCTSQAHDCLHSRAELLHTLFRRRRRTSAAPCHVPIRPHEDGAVLRHLPDLLPLTMYIYKRCRMRREALGRGSPAPDFPAATAVDYAAVVTSRSAGRFYTARQDVAGAQRQASQRRGRLRPRVRVRGRAQDEQQHRLAAAAQLQQIQRGCLAAAYMSTCH